MENKLKPDQSPMGVCQLKINKPVICAIEGACVAGGMEIAMWADLRVGAQNSYYGVFNRRFGVPLIDGGTVRKIFLINLTLCTKMISLISIYCRVSITTAYI